MLASTQARFRIKREVKRVLLPGPGVRTVPFGLARGVKMHIDFAFLTQTYLGVYELELNRFLKQILTPGVTTFDVGVQWGYDSLMAGNRTGASVAAFECDPRCVEVIRKNFDANPRLRHLLRVVPGVVGNGPGDIGLDRWAFGDGGFVPDFIKIDIDGGEVEALQSARTILAEHKPHVLVETHSYELERVCGTLLVEHGYSPIVVNQRKVWPEVRPIPHNRWLVALRG